MTYYITTRVPLEAFEYDHYGFKPEWWLLMVCSGRAFEHKDHATFENINGEQRANTGDRVFLDETGYVGVMTPERFKVCCRMVDSNKDAAPMFVERCKDGIHKFTEALRALRK